MSLRSSRTSAIAACARSKTRIAICARGRWRCTTSSVSACGTRRRAMACPSGMCGLLKRDNLPDVDVGYAFLPQFWGQGFAYEAAAATLRHGARKFGLTRVIGVVSEGNAASIRVLEKLGMSFRAHVRPCAKASPRAALRPHSLRKIASTAAASAASDRIADHLADLRALSTRSSTGRSKRSSPSTTQVEQMCTSIGSSLPQLQPLSFFFLT